MQAAEKLFTSRRFHEITMDDIAAGANVAKGALYLYFRDKEDLFSETCASGLDEMVELLDKQVPEGAPFFDQLLSVCRHISEFHERRRELLRMMQAEEFRLSYTQGDWRERWLEKRQRLVAAVANILAKGVADGVLRSDLPPEVLANVLLGMLRTRGRDLAAFPAQLRSHEVIVDLFCRGAGVSIVSDTPES